LLNVVSCISRETHLLCFFHVTLASTQHWVQPKYQRWESNPLANAYETLSNTNSHWQSSRPWNRTTITKLMRLRRRPRLSTCDIKHLSNHRIPFRYPLG
jgi:hypothetical protein